MRGNLGGWLHLAVAAFGRLGCGVHEGVINVPVHAHACIYMLFCVYVSFGEEREGREEAEQ